ncbi:hypothetical protein C0J52_17341 [Blattella germanica]|nr:hypothetical protein C0J52_17341 [Blattella germanica]
MYHNKKLHIRDSFSINHNCRPSNLTCYLRNKNQLENLIAIFKISVPNLVNIRSSHLGTKSIVDQCYLIEALQLEHNHRKMFYNEDIFQDTISKLSMFVLSDFRYPSYQCLFCQISDIQVDSLFYSMTEHIQGAKILAIFNLNVKSHFFMFETLLKRLAERGHQVYVAGHFPLNKPIRNYVDISVEGSVPALFNNFTIEYGRSLGYWNLWHFIFIHTVEMCETMLQQPQMQEIISGEHKFDLVITEPFGPDCFAGLAHKYNAPLINILSSVALPWVNDRIGNPDNPSYIPNYFLPYSDKMNFFQRVINLMFTEGLKLGEYYFGELAMDELGRKYYGADLPPLSTLKKRTSMLFLNSHFSLNIPRPVVPSFIEVGGLHIRPGGKLPKDIETFMNEAKRGVIYFSLGSLYFISGHPNIELFITHGGLMGVQEGVYAGVPMIGIPLFADQQHNIENCVSKGMAEMVDYDFLSEETMMNALSTVLNNTSYKTNAKQLSTLFKDRPQTALETAIFWTEYVIRHKGAPHLKSAAVDLPFHQYLLLDVLAVILLGVCVTALLLFLIIYKIYTQAKEIKIKLRISTIQGRFSTTEALIKFIGQFGRIAIFKIDRFMKHFHIILTGLLITMSCVDHMDSYKILGLVHLNSRSHFVMFEALFKGLAAKGHEVYVISHFPQKEQIPNYKDISLAGSVPLSVNNFTMDFVKDFGYFNLLDYLWHNIVDMCDKSLGHPSFQKLLSSNDKFDLIITEITVFLFLTQKFNAPAISMTTSVTFPWGNDRFANPENPSYIPNYFVGFCRMNFVERLICTVSLVYAKLGHYYIGETNMEKVFQKHFGNTVPPLSEQKKNTSLILELETFINEAENGVIYFSLGSLVRGESLPKDKLQIFIDVFKHLPQRVVWKIDTIQGLPKNIWTSKWMPQLEILNHSNVRAFISHGGLMGTMEAVHIGVPLVGIPLFADQTLNVKNCVSKGFAIMLDYDLLSKEALSKALNDVLHDPRMKAKNSFHLHQNKHFNQNCYFHILELPMQWLGIILTGVIILSSVDRTTCYKILGLVHLNSMSHFVMQEALYKGLAAKGHEVYVVSHFPQKESIPNYTDISLKGSLPDLVNNFTIESLRNFGIINLCKYIWYTLADMCDTALGHPSFQKLLYSNITFDLIVTEIVGPDCFLFLSRIFKAPVISVTTSVAFPWGNDRFGNPDNPSYIPNYFVPFTHQMSFKERVINTVILATAKLGNYYIGEANMEKVLKKHFGNTFPPLSEQKKDTSLVLVNSHFSLNFPRPSVPAFIEVGGLHIQPGGKLPQDLQTFIENAEHGVVYFCFGSLAQAESLPKEKLQVFIDVFKELPQRVIWKIDNVRDLPSNIWTSKWMPQLEILKCIIFCIVLEHPNVRAFITHGGLMGTQEAVHAGVPMIGIPLFADQELNIRNFVSKGIAILIEYDSLSKERLSEALNAVIHDPSHFSISTPRPMVPTSIEVGGLHLGTPKKLPKDLERYINESTHGVIYFSLGSLVRSETFSSEEIKAFADAFAELPQRVIWKTDTIPGLPKNVLAAKWLPQFDILSHPNVRVFITHGGLMGTQEAVYNGVPMVGIPFYADQHHNIENYESKGIAVKLDYNHISKESVLSVLKTILNNPRYHENAKRISNLFKDRPQTPLETAIYWTEYVIRQRGAPHMRTAAADLPWYQYFLIDVILTLVVAFFLPLLSLYLICKRTMKFLGFTIATSLAFIFLAGTTEAARILALFQFNGKSHFVMFEALLKGLAAKGHDVVVVSHFPQKNPVQNYTDISVEEALTEAVNSFTLDFALNFRYYNLLYFFWQENLEFCEAVFEHPNIKRLIKSEEKFDLVITELFGVDCFTGFAHKFQAPLISMTSSTLLPWANDRMGNPDNPSYIPNYFLSFTDRMTFPERMLNTIFSIGLKWGSYYFSELPTERLARRYLGEDLPPLNEIAKNTSLIFVNSHFSLSTPRPLVPGVVEVGGLHIRTPGKLPQKLQKFIDDAKDGVIFFSLGSLVKGETLPEDKRQAFLSVFSKLPQRIVWKADFMPGLPDNVMTGTWLPQFEILNHPNIRLFITHGGLMGTQEAIYIGVPMIGIPLFSDQKMNIENYVRKGIALKLDFYSITEETLLSSLNTILNDPSYEKNAKRMAALFRDRPQSALETAVFWTEYVIRHQGAFHLRTAAVDMPWYQYLLLDVIATLLLIIILAFVMIYYILKKITSLIFGRKPSSSMNGHLQKSKKH